MRLNWRDFTRCFDMSLMMSVELITCNLSLMLDKHTLREKLANYDKMGSRVGVRRLHNDHFNSGAIIVEVLVNGLL